MLCYPWFAVGVGPSYSTFYFNETTASLHLSSCKRYFHNETTVKPILGKISPGIKFIPAQISTGHLFGHDLFRVIPRLGMGRKSLKTTRRG